MRPQTLLLDLEGTIYTRDGLIEGALGALERVRADRHEVRFLTNTDSQASTSIFAGLLDRGLVVQPTEVFSPIVAARLFLAAAPDSVVLALTTEEVKAELQRGARLSGADGARVTHVVVGDVRDSLSYGLLDAAFQALQSGAELVARQKGRYFLSGRSSHLDTGAIVAALEYASGREAFVVGKPSASFVWPLP